ncbi:murein hydrolase activator EnvC family protein [Albidovulum sediminicola]|uniref:Peptidoglycan DD-metalloendopeptidase family protein n=1 Tax=Albidovulum sediminicola TaxID=2984331 RepID=A0ABT2YXC5_9RHOB|nr:peptidoglycan DD-metalloendopeptidase family protein [Defluviimonas sp. WL0075]MCV2863407.1 peptidoglycan DD-metalloendopeptidase family protein [Defluviimonas sp. WL0075]
MMRAARVLAAASLLAFPAGAQTPAQTATQSAEQAAADLRAAIETLDKADGARNRIAALTQTIRAYELGLGALREGLRSSALKEGEIRARFDARRDTIGQLLAAMAAMEAAPGPLVLLHPDGPEAAARSGMILASVQPALEAEAARLRGDLQEIARMRALQDSALAALQEGLAAAQASRTALSQAVQDRTDLPQRFLEDPEELRALVENAETLEGFARGVARLQSDVGPPMEDFEGAKGTLPLPVVGTLLRRAGEADAAGIVRPGVLIATRPAALVTTPWLATIRYRGPLLDYKNVMILEPASGYLLVLAGLATVYGETGDVLDAGAPVGLMGGEEAALSEGAGAERTETLYIEVRQDAEPIDPAPWFEQLREE